MNIWVVIYEHRYGVDAWPISSVEEPDVDEVIKDLKESEYTDFEPERGETIEIRGPWPIEMLGPWRPVVSLGQLGLADS